MNNIKEGRKKKRKRKPTHRVLIFHHNKNRHTSPYLLRSHRKCLEHLSLLSPIPIETIQDANALSYCFAPSGEFLFANDRHDNYLGMYLYCPAVNTHTKEKKEKEKENKNPLNLPPTYLHPHTLLTNLPSRAPGSPSTPEQPSA